LNHMKKTGIVSLFIACWIAPTTLALAWGFALNWPDFVHVDYGVPITWSTHTLSTIAGPADTWKVDIPSLVLDLIFWLAIMTIAASLLLYTLNRKVA
jgi:hypothetical protein